MAYDSLLESFVLDPGRRSHAIDTLCLEHLGRALQTYQEMTGKGKAEISFAEVAVPQAANYCGMDSATVLALHRFFQPMLAEMQLEPLLLEIEMPLLEVLVDMEWEGITIDRALFQQLSDELGKDLQRLERRHCPRCRHRRKPQFTAAACQHSVREAAASGAEEDEDRPLHRRRRTGTARRNGA